MPTFAELKDFLISETQAQVFVTGVVLCIAIPLIVAFIRYFQLPKQHKSTVEFSKHLITGGASGRFAIKRMLCCMQLLTDRGED